MLSELKTGNGGAMHSLPEFLIARGRIYVRKIQAAV